MEGNGSGVGSKEFVVVKESAESCRNLCQQTGGQLIPDCSTTRKDTTPVSLTKDDLTRVILLVSGQTFCLALFRAKVDRARHADEWFAYKENSVRRQKRKCKMMPQDPNMYEVRMVQVQIQSPPYLAGAAHAWYAL